MTIQIQQLVTLRRQIQKLEKKIDGLLPEAIEEALGIIQEKSIQQSKRKPNQVVFQGESCKVTLVLRKRHDLTSSSLLQVQQEIQAEMERLAETHSEVLESIQSEIESLKQQIDTLEKMKQAHLSSTYLAELHEKYSELVTASEYEVPSLSVYLSDR